MATLNIWEYFSVVSQGTEKTGKQGTSTDAPQTPFAVTVDGLVHQVTGQVDDDEIQTIWDEDDDAPGDMAYFHFWADQDCYLQIIATATNVVFPILAKVPFVLSGNTLLAAANTTPLVAGATPSTTEIDSIIVSNVSGSTLNFVASIVD